MDDRLCKQPQILFTELGSASQDQTTVNKSQYSVDKELNKGVESKKPQTAKCHFKHTYPGT